MNAIRQKLNSRRGASILMALLLFLVCAFVGGSVLAAAYQNAARAPSLRQDQQDYLAVSSAAQLMKDELVGQSVKLRYTVTTTTNEDGSSSTERSRGLAQSYTGLLEPLSQKALAVFTGTGAGGELSLTFDLSGHPELSNVEGSIKMGGDESGYALTILLSNKGGSNELELSFPVSINDSTNHWTSEDGSITKDTTTTTVTWGQPSIRLTSIPKEEGT